MQTQAIVSRLLQCCQGFMHAARWRALRDVSTAAVNGQALTLSALALGTQRATSQRHRVKCVDRLLGNTHLSSEHFETYKALAQVWLHHLPQLLIVVDWSPLSADMHWHLLRASVVVNGRSITVLEQVHPQKDLIARHVHAAFLQALKRLLPASRNPPILITDAGFRGTWFSLVAQQGWHWVGRTRNRELVRRAQQPWIPAKQLYGQATGVAQDLGEYQAVRSRPIRCRFALVKKASAGRKNKYPSGKEKHNAAAKHNARAHREPWLLSYSPALASLGAQAIVQLYAQRMRIEQEFRDTKNWALGMGLSYSRSSGQQRLQALLLIAHIAQLAKRLIGETAKAHQMQLELVSNNTKRRATMSVMTLATRVIACAALLRKIPEVWSAWQTLRRQASEAIDLATCST
jgi:Transposase DDE domain